MNYIYAYPSRLVYLVEKVKSFRHKDMFLSILLYDPLYTKISPPSQFKIILTSIETVEFRKIRKTKKQ